MDVNDVCLKFLHADNHDYYDEADNDNACPVVIKNARFFHRNRDELNIRTLWKKGLRLAERTN